MRKNQKYTQADMYSAIERCRHEGISHLGYCKESGMHYATFKYWVKKYKREQSGTASAKAAFLPVQVEPQEKAISQPTGRITITHSCGTHIECPVDTPVAQLTTLLKAQ